MFLPSHGKVLLFYFRKTLFLLSFQCKFFLLSIYPSIYLSIHTYIVCVWNVAKVKQPTHIIHFSPSYETQLSNLIAEEEKPAAMHGGDRRNLSPAILASNFLVSLLAAVSWRIPSFTNLYPTWITAVPSAVAFYCPSATRVPPSRKRVPGSSFCCSARCDPKKKLHSRGLCAMWYPQTQRYLTRFTL